MSDLGEPRISRFRIRTLDGKDVVIERDHGAMWVEWISATEGGKLMRDGVVVLTGIRFVEYDRA